MKRHSEFAGDLGSVTNRSRAIAVSGEQDAGEDMYENLADLDSLVTSASKIMIVDDEPYNSVVVERYLYKAGYRYFVTVSDSTEAVAMIRRERPDLVLLDIMMPEVSGLDILTMLREDSRLKNVPVIVLTAASDPEMKQQALKQRVSDFLSKPVDPHDLVLRVRNALIVKMHQDHLKNYATELEKQIRQRTAELTVAREEAILCLARAAEFRDNETGNHVLRVGRYVGIIARELGYSDDRAAMLEQAAQLHDVGKIGISDSILLKPGKLDPQEFEHMQKHCAFGRKIIQRLPEHEFEAFKRHVEIGARILNVVRSPVLVLAAKISLTHHEKWDGTGYPLGLAGEDIPVEARMTCIADVYDALSTKRPYKPAFSRKKCFQIMEESRGSHFDPNILDAFFRRRDDIVKVQIDYADED